MTIKANFNIKKVAESKSEEEKLEELLLKSGACGSHMIFRSKDKDETLFIDEL